MGRKNQRKNNSGRRVQRRPKKKIPNNPPVLPSSIVCPIVLRFQKSASTVANVYYASIAKLIVSSVTTTTGFCIYESIRISSITLWSPAFVNATSTGLLVPESSIRFDDSWAGQVSSSNSAIGSERTVRDTPTSGRGIVLHASHDADRWYDCDTINSTFSASPRLYSIAAPLGAIIDLHIVVRLNNARTSAFTALSSSGVTALRTYYNFLDSVSNVGGTGTTILPCINWGGGPTTANWT